MKWLGISLIVIVILLFFFRRRIIRRIKLMDSPFKHFTFDEFDSPDEKGSGKKNMNIEFIRRLDIARDCATKEKGKDFPFKIINGFRTLSYNKKVGGKAASAHTKGVAADIDYNTQKDMEIMLRCLIKVGFKRFGIRWKGSGSSVHVDMDTSKPQYAKWGYADKSGNIIEPPNPFLYA